jgi:hypothetical protein
MKKQLIILALTAVCAHAFSQSVINKGVYIRINQGTSLKLEGPATSYINQISGAAQGAISLKGKMTLTGNFTNYCSNNVFNGQNGTLTFTGNSAQLINGTAPVHFENITVNKTGSTLTLATTNNVITKNLLISAGTLNAADKTLFVKRNWTNNATFIPATSTIIFDGDTAQVIHSGSGLFKNVAFNNTTAGNNDVMLDDNLTVSGSATFTNGIVYSTSAAAIIFSSGATSNGGDSLSFYDGIVSKSGTNAFTFPVGDVQGASAIWAPLAMAAPAQSSVITAEYNYTAPPYNADPAYVCSGIDHVSASEHWHMTSSLSQPDVTIYWKDKIRSGISNLADVTIVNFENCGGQNKYTEKTGNPVADNTWQGHITGTGFTGYDIITFGFINAAPSGTTWTGVVSADWATTGNWSSGVPDIYTNALIAVTATKPVISGTAVCKNLTINNGATLTINSGKSLTASGSTTLNGAQCLVIKSNASGMGSFIDNGTIGGSGTAKVELYISGNAWHYFSKPVTTATAALFNGCYLKKWNENNYTWANITSPTAAFSTLIGYNLKSTVTKTFSFISKPNTGAFSVPVTKNTTQVTTKRGWNLVGNPYPSAIDWDAASGWTKTNIDNAVYVYNPSIGNYMTYINGFGTNGASRYIAPEQGFFITCNNPVGGTFGMTNAVRVHNTVSFYKSSAMQDHLRLTLKSNLNETDEIIICINPESSNEFDGNYDALKIMLPEKPQIWSTNYEDLTTQYSINCIPNTIENTDIPLAFVPVADGLFSITASGHEPLLGQTGIWLEDLKTGVITDLAETNDYTFSASEDDDINRFVLHFSLPKTYGIEGIQKDNNLIVTPNPNNGNMNIVLKEMLPGTTTVVITDVLGKVVYSAVEENYTGGKVCITNTSSGMYLLKVSSDKGCSVRTFVVNK